MLTPIFTDIILVLLLLVVIRLAIRWLMGARGRNAPLYLNTRLNAGPAGVFTPSASVRRAPGPAEPELTVRQEPEKRTETDAEVDERRNLS